MFALMPAGLSLFREQVFRRDMNMFRGLRLKNTNHLYGWVRFDICALFKENPLKELVMYHISWKRPVQVNIQKTLLATQCPQTCYGPLANVPETGRPPLSERKQGEKSLKIQVWMQKKEVTAAESTHVCLRCPQMCVPCYTVWSLHPCSCDSNQRLNFTAQNWRKTSLLDCREIKCTHLLPFCWRTLFACSGSMCTSLVTKECPSPWLKGREIKSEFELRPSQFARTGCALELCMLL